MYKLIDKEGKPYFSECPGTLGGHKKLKIYGRLDCPSALRYIARGQYVEIGCFLRTKKRLLKLDIGRVVVVSKRRISGGKARNNNSIVRIKAAITLSVNQMTQYLKEFSL